MNPRTDIRNLIAIIAVMILAVVIGVFAYFSPSTVLAVANIVVTSISIIFGLSLSLITLASSQVKVSENVVPRAETRRGIERDIEWENERTIFRQKLSVSVLLLSVVLGVLFIGLAEFSPLSKVYFGVGAAFSFFTTLSFAISFVLPFSISNTIRRDRYFRS